MVKGLEGKERDEVSRITSRMNTRRMQQLGEEVGLLARDGL